MCPEQAVGSGSTRLITLRGSSGSGKSTVAAAIRALRPVGSVAILGQDVLRRQILDTGDDRDGHAVELIDAMARLLLDRGFDVIIEGILNAALYTASLVRMVDDHRDVSRSFIWDLSFEETVRRHASKPVATAFGETELRRWWRGFQPVAGLDEEIVGPTEDRDSTAARIVSACWGAEQTP